MTRLCLTAYAFIVGHRIITTLSMPLCASLQVTYMSGFTDMQPSSVVKVTPPHQPSAAWPLYLYHLPHPPSRPHSEQANGEQGGD